MANLKIEDVIHDLNNPDKSLKERHDKAFPGNYLIQNDYSDLEYGVESTLFGGGELTDEQKEIARQVYGTDQADQILTADESKYLPVLENVVKRLEGHGITVDSPYKMLLEKMAIVMSNTRWLLRPIILPARPGLGKTEMLISTLIEKSKMNEEYTAIVVTRRMEDAVRISNQVNEELGKETCYVRPTFALMTLNGKKCMNGHSKDDYYSSICNKDNCIVKSCPAKDKKSFRAREIVLITTKAFSKELDNAESSDLLDLQPISITEDMYMDGYGPPGGYDIIPHRDDLFIDENPGMIFNPLITNDMLNDCMVHLRKNKFDQEHIDEFSSIMGTVASQMGGSEQYEYIDSVDSWNMLSDEFKQAWRSNPPTNADYYSIPEIVNGFIEGGGIKQNKNNYVDYAIGINRYRRIKGIKSRTVILDGTGIKDLTYKPDDFTILLVDEIRSFSRGTLHCYPLSISKSFLYDKQKREKRIKDIADEAIKRIGDKKALFITYKNYANNFKQLFKSHDNIRVNHFGNLIGRNDYKNCIDIVFAGINDWGPREYFSQISAVKGAKVDLSVAQNQGALFVSDEVNEFYSTLVGVELYQALMRSNLRVYSSEEKVNIYLWTHNNEIISQVKGWLPGINVINESVPIELQSTRQPNTISTEAKVLLDKLKGSMSSIHFELKPKLRAHKLSSYLGRVPLREEFKYIWPDIDITHYSRYKKHSQAYLDKVK